jgi:hypothetical protein
MSIAGLLALPGAQNLVQLTVTAVGLVAAFRSRPLDGSPVNPDSMSSAWRFLVIRSGLRRKLRGAFDSCASPSPMPDLSQPRRRVLGALSCDFVHDGEPLGHGVAQLEAAEPRVPRIAMGRAEVLRERAVHVRDPATALAGSGARRRG